MGENMKIKFKFSVGVLFSILLLIMMTIVIIYNYKRTSSIIYTMSDEIVNDSSQIIMQKIENFLLPIENTTSFLSKQIGSEDYFQDREKLLETMWDFMDMYEQVTFIYISDEKGNWVQVRKSPELSTRVINRNSENTDEHTETWKYRDGDYNIIDTKVIKAEYDHRVRPWYKAVRKEYKAYWTNVYIFSSIGEPGITVSFPLIDRETNKHFGAISTDLTFQDLSVFLRENSGDYSQTSFIINENGDVIAHPDMEQLREKQSLENISISNLDEHIAAGYNKLISSKDDSVVYSHRGANYYIKTINFKAIENGWKIVTVLPEEALLSDVKRATYEMILISISILLITLYFILLISESVSRPILNLTENMKSLKKFNFNTHIATSSRIYEINLIENTISEMADSLESNISKRESYEKSLKELNRDLEEIVEKRTAKLDEKNRSLKNILDNTEDGFFALDKELRVGNEYSKNCLEFFGEEIVGKRIEEIIQYNSEDEQKLVLKTFSKILNEKNRLKRQVYISLFPTEFSIGDRIFYIKYNYIYDDKIKNDQYFLIKVRDITEERELKRKRDEDRERVRMIVKVMNDRSTFMELLEELEQFITETMQRDIDIYASDFRRRLHTLKGNLAQYKMISTVKVIHDIEELIEHKKLELEERDRIIYKIKDARHTDLEVIKQTLGEDYLTDAGTIIISKSIFDRIKQRIIDNIKTLTPEQIENEMLKMRYRTLKETLLGYKYYLEEIAEKFEKCEFQFKIAGDEVLLDGIKFNRFLKSLTHLFRNIGDHGLETEDERIEKGKQLIANVDCEIRLKDEKLYLVISDDGRGIDIEKIRNKVAAKNGEKYANSLDDKQIVGMVFQDGISEYDNATEMSGRGIGMSAVKNEVEAIGGNISIESKVGEYTKIIIVFDNQSGIEVL